MFGRITLLKYPFLITILKMSQTERFSLIFLSTWVLMTDNIYFGSTLCVLLTNLVLYVQKCRTALPSLSMLWLNLWMGDELLFSLLFFYLVCDHHRAETEIERMFKYPLDLKLSWRDNRLVVVFGQHDGIKVGYSLMAVNGQPVVSRKLGDVDVLEDVLEDVSHYPLTLKFGIAPLSSNEKIVFASMFHSMCTIASLQINRNCIKDPSKSRDIASGIEVLETDNFRLNCFQTLTGLKIIVMSDLSSFSPRKEVLKFMTCTPIMH